MASSSPPRRAPWLATPPVPTPPVPTSLVAISPVATSPVATSPVATSLVGGPGLAAGGASPRGGRTVPRLQAHRAEGELAARRWPSPYELAPGNEDTESLPALLDHVVASRARASAFHSWMAERLTALGLEPPSLDALRAHPGALIDHLVVPMRTLKTIANTASRVSPDRAPPPPSWKLSAGTDIQSAFEAELPARTLKTVAPGVLRGWPASSLDDAEALKRVRMAKVFDTLVENAALPEAERIPLRYKRAAFTRLDALLDRLEADGHSITIVFEQRTADFLGLHRVEGGVRRAVAAPLMIDTQHRDAAGQRIIVPAAHGEMQVRIAPPEGGDGIEADLRFYQGTGMTGFMPNGLEVAQPWAGRARSSAYAGARAWETVRLAGDLQNVIESISGARHLRLSGYGVTGVCNDTAAILSAFLTGKADFFPRALDQDLLRGALARWRTEGRGDEARLAELDALIASLPADTEPRPDQPQRILASMTSDMFARTAPTRRALEAMISAPHLGTHSGAEPK